MQLVVDLNLPAQIEIGAQGLKGLAQEIRTVLTTRKGSVPLDRDFGLDFSFVDMPMPYAMQSMIAEIGQKLEKYVPRVKVLNIAFNSENPLEGNLKPIITVEIRPQFLAEFKEART